MLSRSKEGSLQITIHLLLGTAGDYLEQEAVEYPQDWWQETES